MKKLLGLTLILGTVFTITGCVSNISDNTDNSIDQNTNPIEQPESIKAENFSALEPDTFLSLQKELDGIIIDIRTPGEIENGKITDTALELDYYSADFKESLEKLDKTKAYFIYCAHGNRTRGTKDTMKSLGFKTVYDLKGGISVIE